MTTLTKSGQQLANALQGAGFSTRWDDPAALNAAAEILMPAGEGAGLRDAARTLLDACHADFGKPESDDAEYRDDGPVGLGSRGPTVVTFAMMRDLDAALASPQSAIEGPIAAGVEEAYDAAQNAAWEVARPHIAENFRQGQDPGPLKDQGEDVRRIGRLEIIAAISAYLATLTPPADPKPTVPGNDAGMREAAQAVSDLFDARGALFCSGEHQLEVVRRLRAALAPQTGSAGEDPKTPAGVGEAQSEPGINPYGMGEEGFAYACEIATEQRPDGTWTNWCRHVERAKPSGPEGSIRHVVPLYPRAFFEGEIGAVDRIDYLERQLAALSAAPAARPGDGVGLTLKELHTANIARQAEWCPDQVPDLSFRGNELAGEAGEVSEALILHAAEIGRAVGRTSNVIKKLERERQGWRGSRATLNDLAEELADVVICADLCAVTAGIDLSAAVIAKFNATSDKVGISVRLAAGSVADGGRA